MHAARPPAVHPAKQLLLHLLQAAAAPQLRLLQTTLCGIAVTAEDACSYMLLLLLLLLLLLSLVVCLVCQRS
jgi:hypothetical protein